MRQETYVENGHIVLPAELESGSWLEFFPILRGAAAQPSTATFGVPSGAVARMIDGLQSGVHYRFAVAAFSVTGLGEVSSFSTPIATLPSLVSDVRAFVGPPCVYQNGGIR